LVSRLIANYPRVIAVRGDNLNVGTYPDPSSSTTLDVLITLCGICL